jgi:Spy/CpxP family protein refolding chaperone
MLKSLALAVIATVAFAPSWAADAPAAAATATAAQKPDVEKAVAQFRADLQAARADVMAKSLTLTAEQASKFWPLYERYQKEQNAIVDNQLKAIRKYSDSFDTLTDADSLAYVKALLERDVQMQALRVKWLETFQTALPGGLAARAIQIDRRVSLVAQAQLSSQIPLVH